MSRVAGQATLGQIVRASVFFFFSTLKVYLEYISICVLSLTCRNHLSPDLVNLLLKMKEGTLFHESRHSPCFLSQCIAK